MCVCCLNTIMFMLMPSCAILMMCSINSRSLQHSSLMGIDRLIFALVWRLPSLLKKWWTNGIAIPRYPSCLVMLSTSLAVVVPLLMLCRWGFSRWQACLSVMSQEDTLCPVSSKDGILLLQSCLCLKFVPCLNIFAWYWLVRVHWVHTNVTGN